MSYNDSNDPDLPDWYLEFDREFQKSMKELESYIRALRGELDPGNLVYLDDYRKKRRDDE